MKTSSYIRKRALNQCSADGRTGLLYLHKLHLLYTAWLLHPGSSWFASQHIHRALAGQSAHVSSEIAAALVTVTKDGAVQLTTLHAQKTSLKADSEEQLKSWEKKKGCVNPVLGTSQPENVLVLISSKWHVVALSPSWADALQTVSKWQPQDTLLALSWTPYNHQNNRPYFITQPAPEKIRC